MPAPAKLVADEPSVCSLTEKREEIRFPKDEREREGERGRERGVEMSVRSEGE